MVFRAALFDAAGTLIRLAEPVGETYARLASGFCPDPDPRRLQDEFAKTWHSMPAMVFPTVPPEGIPALERAWWRELVGKTFAAATGAWLPDSFDAFFDRLFRHFATTDAWRLAPGARPLLVELRRRRVRTGVVSNFDHRLHELLQALRLRPLLDTVVLPGDAGAAKPDARIFHVALQRLGVSARDALYVGDDPKEDLEGARAAGLTAIDVTKLDGLEDLLRLTAVTEAVK